MRRTLRLFVFAVLLPVAAGTAAAQASKSVWSGVYSPAQAATGEELYMSACVDCHGPDLEGRERAPALAGGAFGQKWDGATLKKLFEQMEEMPPDDPAARLSARQYADILAFLLSANNVPAGTQPIGVDKAVLADIRYTSQRPK